MVLTPSILRRLGLGIAVRLRESKFLIVLACAPLLLFTSLSSGADQAQTSTRERFESEAVLHWQPLQASMLPMSGEESWTHDFRSTNPKYAKSNWSKRVMRFWLTESAGKVICDGYDRSGKWTARSVYCFNPSYAFTLKQATPDGPYFITKHGRDPATFESVRSYVTTLLSALQMSYMMADGRPLAELVKSRGFEVLSCSVVEIGDRKLVAVECRFNAPDGYAPGAREARLVLDPGADWRVVSTVLKYGAWTISADVSYAPNQSSYGAILRATEHAVATDGAEAMDTYEFSKLSFESTSPHELLLPAFGLPEIRSESNIRFWRLLTAGLSLIGIGVLLYFAYRRRAQADAAKPCS